jgi:sulfate adenylyltransferase (ADP) / ATP adenylyltransferase
MGTPRAEITTCFLLYALFLVEFQSQTSPLSPSDLVQAYLLLRAARAAGKHIFAFYNCA